MSLIWPFRPLIDFTDTLEWLTDIIETKSDEQRISLRDLPRRTFGMRHLLQGTNYAAAIAYITASDDYLVPDWTNKFSIGNVSSGSNVSNILIPDYYFGFNLNDNVIVWQSESKFEQAVIEDIDSNNIITLDNISNDYDNANILPLLSVNAIEGLSIERIKYDVSILSINMSSYDGYDLSESHYDTYRDIDVLTDSPVLNGGLSENHGFEFESFDANFGSPYYVRERSIIDTVVSMNWIAKSREEIYRLRNFFYRNKGSMKTFWFSSRSKDFSLHSPIGSGDTAIIVNDYPGLTGLGKDVPFDIDITLKNGTSYYRQVTSQSANTSSTRLLNIVTSLGVDVSIYDVKRISNLRCVRLDSDTVTFEYLSMNKAKVSISLKQVKYPT